MTDHIPRPDPVTIGVDRVELLALFADLGVEPPSIVSPLRSIADPQATEGARPPAEIIASVDADVDTLRRSLQPLAAPDRLLDLTTATFETAPAPARLCSSRRLGPSWACVRTGSACDLELLAPISDDDLATWVRLQLELSAGADIPVPWEQLTGAQLAFLLVLLDAHAAVVHTSYAQRRAQPASAGVHLSDILQAQADALSTRDRRWLSTALLEVFDLLVHPGGRRGVGLPPVTRSLASDEITRYVDNGWLQVDAAGDNPSVTLAGPLPAVAATLGNWLQLVSLHDTQITGWAEERAVAQHDAVVFVVGASATWAISTIGLNAAGDDLSDVGFRLHTVNVVSGERLVEALLAPLPAEDLPDEVYAAAAEPPPAPASAPLPPPAASLAPPSGTLAAPIPSDSALPPPAPPGLA